MPQNIYVHKTWWPIITYRSVASRTFTLKPRSLKKMPRWLRFVRRYFCRSDARSEPFVRRTSSASGARSFSCSMNATTRSFSPNAGVPDGLGHHVGATVVVVRVGVGHLDGGGHAVGGGHTVGLPRRRLCTLGGSPGPPSPPAPAAGGPAPQRTPGRCLGPGRPDGPGALGAVFEPRPRPRTPGAPRQVRLPGAPYCPAFAGGGCVDVCSVCMSVWMSVSCLSGSHLNVCLNVCLDICRISVWMSVGMSVHMSVLDDVWVSSGCRLNVCSDVF